MTQSTHNTPLLHRVITLIRGCLVAVLMLPGTGFALFAAACGDLAVSPAVSVDAHNDAIDASGSSALAPRVMPATERVVVAEAPEPAPLAPRASPLSEVLPLIEAPDPPQECPDEPPTSLAVVQSALAHGVSKRRPVRPATEFAVGDVAWAWVSIKNTGDAQPATMVWSRDGQVRSRLTLDIGTSPRWRTWSRRTMRPSDVGAWHVEVQDGQGQVIHTLRFDVVPHAETLSLVDSPFDGC
jgi:hypothetical protein